MELWKGVEHVFEVLRGHHQGDQELVASVELDELCNHWREGAITFLFEEATNMSIVKCKSLFFRVY